MLCQYLQDGLQITVSLCSLVFVSSLPLEKCVRCCGAFPCQLTLSAAQLIKMNYLSSALIS